MASLQIKDETVYVIYRNGEPYQGRGQKLVYTTKGAAKCVILSDSYDETELNYEGFDWRALSNEERNKLVEKVKSEFEVVEYTPKGH